MPRKVEPSFELKKIICDIAAKAEKDNLSAIQRQLDYELQKRRKDEEGDFFENIPDNRTISRIIKRDINELYPEVVVSKLEPHVWRLRNDYDGIVQLAEGRSQASQKEVDPLVAKAKDEHLADICTLIQEEKKLLISALLDRSIYLLRLNEGDFIRAGNKNFPDDKTSDPADFEKYFEALESLKDRGYVRYDTGILYKLTTSGLQKAKELTRKKQR